MNQSEPIPPFIATREEYKRALKRVRDEEHLTSRMLDMLKLQFNAPARTVTATELARTLGSENHGTANLQYGTLGKLIAEALNHIPCKRADGTHRYWTALSTGDSEQDDGEHFRFVMRTELAQALQEMRWC